MFGWLTPINNLAMNTYLSLGLVLLVLAPTYFALRHVRPPKRDERQEDLPSLQSIVSSFPRHSRSDPSEDTAPSILTRHPEWDTQ